MHNFNSSSLSFMITATTTAEQKAERKIIIIINLGQERKKERNNMDLGNFNDLLFNVWTNFFFPFNIIFALKHH